MYGRHKEQGQSELLLRQASKNEAFIEVKKGLEAGSLVIVNVPDSLRDQQKIAVTPLISRVSAIPVGIGYIQ